MTMIAAGDRTAPVLVAAITAAVMIAQHVAASAVRDAFFLANYPASALPGAMIASSLLSVAFLPILARMLARFGPAIVTPSTSALSALLLIAEWMLSLRRPGLAAVALFVHTMVFGSALVSGFWSLFNERFDPHTAKQLIGRVAGGAALGGVLGGLIVERAGAAGIALPSLLPVLAAAQLLAAAGSWVLRSGPQRGERSVPDPPAEPFLKTLSGSTYLQGIALLVGLTAFVSTITGFLLKAQVAGTHAEAGELLRFFARYYLALGLLGFLLQINVTRWSLNRFGLAITIATLPASIAALGIVGMVAPALWSLALLRGVDEALSNSLFRSGYELLYTPIASGTKRRFKAIADVGFDRLGKTIGSTLLALALWGFSDTPIRMLLGVTVIGAVATLLVAIALRRGYVTSLSRSLQSHAVSLDENAMAEAMTLRTLAGSGLDRDTVKASLADGSGGAAPGIDFAGGETMWGTQAILVRRDRSRIEDATRESDAAKTPLDPMLAQIAELRSGDSYRVRRALTDLTANASLDRHLAPHVVSLLGNADVAGDAVRALRTALEHSTGQMVDVLLDPGTNPLIRRRLPQVLAGAGSQTVVHGLLQALDDPEFEVRFRSAGALIRTREAHPALAIPWDTVLAAAARESRRARLSIEDQRPDDRALELVFRILALVLDPEPLWLARHVLQCGDAHLKGTALEYLETVVPASVLVEIRPLFGTVVQAGARARSAKELEGALLASSAAVSIDVGGLRRALREGDAGDRDV